MDIETVVKEVTVRGSAQGMDQVATAYNNVATSADGSAVSLKNASSSAVIAESALNKLSSQLQDNFNQQQQFNDMVAQQGKALQSAAAANDNVQSAYRGSGIEIAAVANHLRQAAEAAYAFSPAFRGVVNEMAVPALGAASSALAMVAAGMVTATNMAGTGVIRLGTAIETTFPALAGISGSIKGAGAAMEAFSPTIGTAAGSLLSFLAPALKVFGWFMLMVDAIKLVSQAWDLGNAKLAEYVALSEKAAAAGLSTDFFQQITKAATDAKLPVDALTAAVKTLNAATADKLGGSTGQNSIDTLVKAGNFTGNSGVAQLANANSTEEKFRAISSLIDQAMQKGERLAALDVAKTFLGDAVSGNLAKDSDYLTKMLATADKVKSEDLVSQASVDNAVALQGRLDAAEKILSERWHPIQDILIAGGILMKETWVNIVENMASAVDWATKLMAKLGDAPSWFVQKMNEGATAFMNLTTTPESRKAAEADHGITSDPAEMAMLAARLKLGSGLQNPANVSAATDQINTIQNKVFPDVSKDPNAKAVEDSTAAYDRAEESLLKYVQVTNAAAQSVDASVGEHERLKAIAELTAAGIKDGLTPAAAAAKAQMSGLAEQAAAAADALAKAKIASEIKFGANTALLSQGDVAIATQLKGIYPDVATALNSAEAAQLRFNAATKETGGAIENNLVTGLTDIADGQKKVGQGASDMGLAFAKAVEQMIIKIAIVQPLMQALQSTANSMGIFGFSGSVNSNGSIAGAVGPTSVGGAPLVGLHGGGMVGSEATFTRYVHPAYFDDAPRFHGGGIAGDEVPIIAKRGEGVFTEGQMAAMGGRSAPVVNVTLIESPNGGGTVTQKQNSNGGIDIEVAIAQISAKSAGTPGAPLNRVITDQLGGAQRLARR